MNPWLHKKPTVLASYTTPHVVDESLCPMSLISAGSVGKPQPYKDPFFLPAIMQQRDNSPGLQQDSGYLLIMLSLLARSVPHEQPRGQTPSHLSSTEDGASMLALQPTPSSPIKELCWQATLTNHPGLPEPGRDGAAGPGRAADCRHVCAHC